MHDPIALVSRYVPALTRLLASPTWKALALDPEGNSVFVDEVRRTVEPSYRWNPCPYWRYVEPLAPMLQDEAEDGTLAMEVEASFWCRHGVRARDHTPARSSNLASCAIIPETGSSPPSQSFCRTAG
jgi:hypothetical protein